MALGKAAPGVPAFAVAECALARGVAAAQACNDVQQDAPACTAGASFGEQPVASRRASLQLIAGSQPRYKPGMVKIGHQPLAPADIALIEASWRRARELGDAVPELFYARLFELAPSVRTLFPVELTEQGRKLMAMLGAIVAGLSDLPQLAPQARALALRHVDYGVQAAHYAVVGEALISTLKQGLGEAFGREAAAAWAKAYGILAGYMVQEAYPIERALPILRAARPGAGQARPWG